MGSPFDTYYYDQFGVQQQLSEDGKSMIVDGDGNMGTMLEGWLLLL